MAGTRYLGVAEEPSFGTKVTTDTEFLYEDVASVGLDVPDKQALIYNGITRRVPQLTAKGPYIPKGDIEMPVDGVVFGFILKWALGDYISARQTEGGLAIFQHIFRDGNALSSFTSRVGKELFEHVFEGCKIVSVKININNKDFIKSSVTIVAKRDTKAAIKDEADITTKEVTFYSFVHASITIDNLPYNVKGIDIEINNNIKGEDGMRVGSRFPLQFDVADLDVKISVTAPFEVTTHLTNYYNNATTPTSIVNKAVVIAIASDDTEIVTGSGIYYGVTFTIPRTIYDGVSQPIKGRDEMEQKIELSTLYDQTAGYAIQAALTTDFPAYSLDTFFRSINATSATAAWATGSRGRIYATADGTTWATQGTTALTGFECNINCVRMFSATKGYACGDNGKIFYTADGAVWADVSPTGATAYDFHGIFPLSATEAFAVGTGGKIYHTSNSGVAWTSETSGITTNLYAIDGITAVYIAVGAGGVILTSTNGTTWTPRTSGQTVDFLAVYCFDGTPDFHIAVGEDGKAISSADGTTWADVSISGCTEDLRGVCALSATVAVAVGNNNTIYSTANAGVAWAAVDDDQEVVIEWYDISIVDATKWWICGSFEHVMYTADAGATWTKMTI